MLFASRGLGQKGFTLIEMSIVLVIIGLIIGGILKGQEIIESARLKNFITQVDSMRAGVNTFFDRYNALPGDFNCAEPGGACPAGRLAAAADGAINNGDGDGTIGASVAGTANINAFNGAAGGIENVQFFAHLARANLIEGVVASVSAQTGFGDGAAIPSVAFPSAGATLVYANYNDFAAAAKLAHWLNVHRNATTPAAALSGKQMFELDKKIDDSLPASGTFRSGLQAAACGSNTNAGYTPTSETVACTAQIDLIQ